MELMERTLAGFDPETRHQVIETMRVLRDMPVRVAVRVLAQAGADARMRAEASRFRMPG
jgi:hypothetical protein